MKKIIIPFVIVLLSMFFLISCNKCDICKSYEKCKRQKCGELERSIKNEHVLIFDSEKIINGKIYELNDVLRDTTIYKCIYLYMAEKDALFIDKNTLEIYNDICNFPFNDYNSDCTSLAFDADVYRYKELINDPFHPTYYLHWNLFFTKVVFE